METTSSKRRQGKMEAQLQHRTDTRKKERDKKKETEIEAGSSHDWKLIPWFKLDSP